MEIEFPYLTESSLMELFSLFHGTFRKNPSLITVSEIFIQQQNFSVKYHDTAAARCFDHCNPSCAFSKPGHLNHSIYLFFRFLNVFFSHIQVPSEGAFPAEMKVCSLHPAFQVPSGEDFIRFSGASAMDKRIRRSPDHPAALPAVFRREQDPDRSRHQLPHPVSHPAQA